MITEDYVSFEIAKLLKEKGFSELCSYYYFSNGMKMYKRQGLRDRNSPNVNTYSAPTLQMAMKWLREMHKLFIKIDFVVLTSVWAIITDGNVFYVIDNDNKNYDKYEQACEAAIKYCLENLI